MPLTTFTSDNVRKSPTNFPRVKLEAHEKARVVCIEPRPTFEWVHELQKPAISNNTGIPIMETRYKKNGESYETHQKDFIGRPICLGDPDILDDRGSDPDHCPACQLARDLGSTPRDLDPSPVRRYAIHVLQYATTLGSAQVAQPFSVATRVWILTENRYAKLVSLFEEAGVDDPRKLDLALDLGDKPVHYQNYEITVAVDGKCWIRVSEENMRRAVATYKESHAADLSAFCGRAVRRELIVEDCDRIRDAWLAVRRYEQSGEAAPVAEMEPSELGLDSSLLDTIGGIGTAPAAVSPSALTAAVTAEEGRSVPEAAAEPLTSLTDGAERDQEVRAPSGLDEFAADTTSNPPEKAARAESSAPQPALGEVTAASPPSGAVSFQDLFDDLLSELPSQ